jgi:hypothetical protein
MPTIDATTEQTETPTETPSEQSCPVCRHPREDHDRIAARFCDATVAGAFERACVCGT